jgi:flagellar biosynthesis protein
VKRKNNNFKARLAIAISYDENYMQAPLVSAIGKRKTADHITNVARRYGVPIKLNTTLAEQLSVLPEDEEIPPQHYYEVAHLLSRYGKNPSK